MTVTHAQPRSLGDVTKNYHQGLSPRIVTKNCHQRFHRGEGLVRDILEMSLNRDEKARNEERLQKKGHTTPYSIHIVDVVDVGFCIPMVLSTLLPT